MDLDCCSSNVFDNHHVDSIVRLNSTNDWSRIERMVQPMEVEQQLDCSNRSSRHSSEHKPLDREYHYRSSNKVEQHLEFEERSCRNPVEEHLEFDS